MSCVFIAFTLKNSSVAEFFVEIANKLSDKHKVIILSHATEKNQLQINPKVEIVNWPGNKPNSFKGLIFLDKLIRKNKPDTVIANFSTVNIMMLLAFLHGVKKRIAWYHTLSTQLEKRIFNRWRKRIFYGLATKIICNSNAAKNDIIKVFRLNPRKVCVVYNAIRKNLNNLEQYKNEQIVYAGRLHPIKGVDILIKAMPIVKEFFPKIHLIIIGHDENSGELQKLENLKTTLDVGENISFIGNRSKAVVLKKFGESYCTIVPSKFESFGYVVIESFSTGTPVIGTDTTGIKEIIRDKMDGFLFKPGDHKDLAEKIITLLKDENLRMRFSENCTERFNEKFEIEKVSSQFTLEHV